MSERRLMQRQKDISSGVGRAGCDALLIFYALGQNLDKITRFLATLVVSDGILARLSAKDVDLYASVFQCPRSQLALHPRAASSSTGHPAAPQRRCSC